MPVIICAEDKSVQVIENLLIKEASIFCCQINESIFKKAYKFYNYFDFRVNFPPYGNYLLHSYLVAYHNYNYYLLVKDKVKSLKFKKVYL